jgi:hypothetical protein
MGSFRRSASVPAAAVVAALALLPLESYADDSMTQGYMAATGILGYVSSAVHDGAAKEASSGLALGVNLEYFRMFSKIDAFAEVSAVAAIGLTDGEPDNIFSVFARGHVGVGISDASGGATVGGGPMFDTLSKRAGGYVSWMLFDKKGARVTVRELWGGYYPVDGGGFAMGGSWGMVGAGMRGAIFARFFGAGSERYPPSGGMFVTGFEIGWGAANSK